MATKPRYFGRTLVSEVYKEEKSLTVRLRGDQALSLAEKILRAAKSKLLIEVTVHDPKPETSKFHVTVNSKTYEDALLEAIYGRDSKGSSDGKGKI